METGQRNWNFDNSAGHYLCLLINRLRRTRSMIYGYDQGKENVFEAFYGYGFLIGIIRIKSRAVLRETACNAMMSKARIIIYYVCAAC